MSSFSASTTGNEVVDLFADRVKGKTVVITGPSASSLGAETAKTLARGHPAKIALLGRTANKIEPVIDEIKRIDSNINAFFVPIELNSFNSVREAAAMVGKKVDKIDYLINNAGIMAPKDHSLSEDGIESQFAVNHLSHFLLTSLLLSKILVAGEGSRIVNVSSDGYKISPVRFDDYNFDEGYERWTAYGQAKTAQILFARRLASKLRPHGVQTYAIHPGVIYNTGLAAGMGMDESIQEGISTCLVALLDPALADRTGSYLEDCNVLDVMDHAEGNDNEDKLWALSEGLTGQAFNV
ncbi:putative short-chain dehydrogenase [Phaeomoniella chlamydospora]|uniref:Putative short-chain dehydrogenase n=1 Tax=Phaeomoniella chlamydospora TaxID=158046 RepID=A0A0G2HJW6_PHACM|nr:putative short-chain dehydrogenase [Phaeomoniella chlamydospora]